MQLPSLIIKQQYKTNVNNEKSIYFTWKCIITAIFSKNDVVIKI